MAKTSPSSSEPGMVSAVLAMMLVQTAVMIGVVAVPVMAPLLSETLGFPAGFAGGFQSLAFAAAALMTVVAGTLVGRYGAIRINQLCCILTAIGLCLPTLAGVDRALGDMAIAAFAAGAFVAGAGYGMATPGASHVLARVTPAHMRGFVFSVKQSAVTLGGLIAGVMVPPLAQWLGWQQTLLLLALSAATCAVLVHPLVKRLDADRNARAQLDLGAVLANIALVWHTPSLRPICVTAFVYACVQCALFALYVTLLVDQVGSTLIEAGWLYAVMQGTGVVARIGWGWLNDRGVSAHNILAWIGIGTIAATSALASANSDWSWTALLVVSVVLGATTVSWNGVYLAEIPRRVAAAKVSAATSGTVMFSFIGVVIGPATFAAVASTSGSYAGAIIGFNVTIAISVVYLLSTRASGAASPAH
jgi:MFS family permease